VLGINLKATVARAASFSTRVLILALTFVVLACFGLLAWLARPGSGKTQI
jgi:hypothetical protein